MQQDVRYVIFLASGGGSRLLSHVLPVANAWRVFGKKYKDAYDSRCAHYSSVLLILHTVNPCERNTCNQCNLLKIIIVSFISICRSKQSRFQ